MTKKIKQVKLDGRKAYVAEMGNGLVKILFEDGEMRIAVPAEDVEKEPAEDVEKEKDAADE